MKLGWFLSYMRILLGLRIIKGYSDYILEKTIRIIGNGLMPAKKMP